MRSAVLVIAPGAREPEQINVEAKRDLDIFDV
jgi:hypothetical protein